MGAVPAKASRSHSFVECHEFNYYNLEFGKALRLCLPVSFLILLSLSSDRLVSIFRERMIAHRECRRFSSKK